MVLYKLPFAIFPVKDIYARSRDDIEEWLERYKNDPFEIVTKQDEEAGTISDIITVQKGELLYDFGGLVSGREYAEIDILPDFMVKIRLESIPFFPSYLTRFAGKERRKLISGAEF